MPFFDQAVKYVHSNSHNKFYTVDPSEPYQIWTVICPTMHQIPPNSLSPLSVLLYLFPSNNIYN